MTTSARPGPIPPTGFWRAIRARIAPLARHPAVALLAVVVVFAIAHVLASNHAAIVYSPVMTRGQPLSKLVFLAGCLVVIACGRFAPRARDAVHVACGMAWSVYVLGVGTTAGLLAIAGLLALFAHRLNAYLAMLLTVVGLLALFRFLPPELGVNVDGQSVLELATVTAGRGFATWSAARLVVYAYEAPALRRHERSLLALLSYAPFNILLAPGDPPMASYLMYRTARPQHELDGLGVAQLHRAALKYLGCVAIACAGDLVLPPGVAFGRLPSAWRLGVSCLGLFTFYLRVSALADLTTGMSNLAGYYATDTFDWPLLARTPLEFWRRWNMHVMRFIKLTCFLPLVRRKRHVGLILVAVLFTTSAIHAFANAIDAAPDTFRTFTPVLLIEIWTFLPMFVALVAMSFLQKQLERLGWVTRVITIGIAMWMLRNDARALWW